MCSSSIVAEAKAKSDQFIERKSDENPSFSFWSNYIEMVQLVLLYIRATRTSDWSLYLSSLRSMIALFFVTG